MTNFDKLIKIIVKPLVKHPNDVTITHHESQSFYEYHLKTNPEDTGRIIGKSGHVVQTIRTIIYSVRISNGKRVRLIVDDNK